MKQVVHPAGIDAPETSSQAPDGLAPPGEHGLYALRIGQFLLAVLATIVFGVVDWQRVETKAEREVIAKAALVREYALRLIEMQEILLRSAEGAVAELRDTPQRDLQAHRFLASLDDGIEQVIRLALISPDGEFLLSSKEFPARGDVGYRDNAPAALAGAEPVIDRLVILPENRDVLIVSRASSGAAVPGVWNSALDIKVVTDFLQIVSPNARDAASLLRADGMELVRQVVTQRPFILGPDHPAMQRIARSDRGTYTARAESDGVRRFYAYERVGDLPLFAIAGVAYSGVFWTWFWQTALFGGILGALAVATLQFVRVAELERVVELDRIRNRLDSSLRASAERAADLRETLLWELNHRIKNSLGMISRLISIERRRSDGPDLDTLNARVVALARIYDLLHTSPYNRIIDLWELIRTICINDAFAPAERGITIDCAGHSTLVGEWIASPIAMCLIELVTNAQKHAFDERGGRIRVTLKTDDKMATLHVDDDGCGMPQEKLRYSGILVVEALVRQLEGRLDIEGGSDGTKITIAFRLAL